MPSERHHNATPGKSFTPTLGSTFRSSRSPLTPRLAGSGTPTSSNVFRKGATVDSASTPNLVRKDNDISTPVSSFLSSNITPRSGSRKARVDSSPSTPAGTPNGTPVHSRATSTVETSGRGIQASKDWTGLGITTYNGRTKTRPQSGNTDPGDLDFNSQSDSVYGEEDRQDVISPTTAPLFFHADDAKSAVSGQEPNVKPVLKANPPTFFYANGGTDGHTNPPRANGISSYDDPPPKMIRINGNSSGRSPPPRALTIRSPSPPKSNLQNRPPSPLKESYPVNRSSSHGTTLSRPNSRLDGIELPPAASAKFQQPACTERRRTSVGSSRQYISHAKSGSLESTSSGASRGPSRSSSLKVRPRSTSMCNAANEILNTSATTTSPVRSPHVTDSVPRAVLQSPGAPLSPTKSSESSHGANFSQQADLAASARRERKVLDLEISNSSLLAINRTLEREMRKQTAELRRYKRLSRAGRLSMIPGPSRAVSGLTTVSEIDDPSSLFNSSPNSPTASEFSLDLSPSDDESSLVTDDGPLSPAAQAANDARHRQKDEARLHLDLAKHQQLLIDSQKVNQSIQRCLGWTEELIKEGKKALEYHVHVSDVEIGGKVLISEEVDADAESREDQEAIGGGRLLSPSLDVERVSWSGLGDETGEEDVVPSIEAFRDEGQLLDSGDDPGETLRGCPRESSPFVVTPGVD